MNDCDTQPLTEPCTDEPDNSSASRSAKPTKPFRWRAWLSLVSLVLFAATAFSGLVLAFAPAHQSGRSWWQLWGVSVHQWGNFHTIVTLAFVVSAVAHVALNARALWCYVRRRPRPQGSEVLWAAVAGSAILALGVWQPVALQCLLPGPNATAERSPGGRGRRVRTPYVVERLHDGSGATAAATRVGRERGRGRPWRRGRSLP